MAWYSGSHCHGKPVGGALGHEVRMLQAKLQHWKLAWVGNLSKILIQIHVTSEHTVFEVVGVLNL